MDDATNELIAAVGRMINKNCLYKRNQVPDREEAKQWVNPERNDEQISYAKKLSTSLMNKTGLMQVEILHFCEYDDMIRLALLTKNA